MHGEWGLNPSRTARWEAYELVTGQSHVRPVAAKTPAAIRALSRIGAEAGCLRPTLEGADFAYAPTVVGAVDPRTGVMKRPAREWLDASV